MLRSRSPITCMTFSRDGRRLYMCNEKGEIHEWLVYKGFTHPNIKSDYRIVTTDAEAIKCIRFMRDGTYFLIGDVDGMVRIYRPNIEKMLVVNAHTKDQKTVGGLSYPVTSIAPSATNLKFCSAAEDATVKIWDLESISHGIKRHVPLQKFNGHGGNVLTVDWHPKKSLVVSGSEDSMIKLWDPRDNNCLSTIHEHTSSINTLEFNQNGNWLLSASDDKTCRLFDIRINRELQRFTWHIQNVKCATWHPTQEDVFVSGANDGSILYWLVGYDNPQGECRQGHYCRTTCMAWHPLGYMLGTGTKDADVKLWVRSNLGESAHKHTNPLLNKTQSEDAWVKLTPNSIKPTTIYDSPSTFLNSTLPLPIPGLEPSVDSERFNDIKTLQTYSSMVIPDTSKKSDCITKTELLVNQHKGSKRPSIRNPNRYLISKSSKSWRILDECTTSNRTLNGMNFLHSVTPSSLYARLEDEKYRQIKEERIVKKPSPLGTNCSKFKK